MEQLDRCDLPSTFYLDSDLLSTTGGEVRQRDLPLSSSFDPVTGRLTILGSDARDSVAFSAMGNLVKVDLYSYPPGGTMVAKTEYYVHGSVRKVHFNGYGGDDKQLRHHQRLPGLRRQLEGHTLQPLGA